MEERQVMKTKLIYCESAAALTEENIDFRSAL